jgi:glycosyltransferase involved in cell wall biosynthesis
MKIFIQIASYRDPELKPTIKSCLENAKNPNNLIFGICRQYHPDDKFDDLSEFEKDDRFKVLNIPYQESLGVCWARNQVQQLYNEEEYTLQIDSHMRFEKDWDETLIGMIKQLQELGIPKPLLTGYVPSYDPNNDPEGRVRVPWRMVFDKFTSDGIVTFLPEILPEWENIHIPIPTRFYSAGFCFTLGDFVKEIQHNPKLYFYGEEITIAVRAFTYGYDLFHPHRVVLWHEYIRKNKKKHWDDDKKWSEKNKISIFLVKRLFGIDGEPMDEIGSKYGLGNIRTLREYEKFAGIVFQNKMIHSETLNKKYPPNTEYDTEQEWLNSFTKNFTYCIKLDVNEFKEDDYDFWAVTFHNENGEEIHRSDCTEQEIQNYLKIKFINICRNFLITNNPKSWSVWTHSKSKGWIKQYIGNI